MLPSHKPSHSLVSWKKGKIPLPLSSIAYPDDLADLKALFQEQNFQAVYFKNHLDKAYYLTGYGSRDQVCQTLQNAVSVP